MRNIQLLALLLSKIKRRIRCYDIKKILLFAITVLEATSAKVLSSNFNLSRSVSLRKEQKFSSLNSHIIILWPMADRITIKNIKILFKIIKLLSKYKTSQSYQVPVPKFMHFYLPVKINFEDVRIQGSQSFGDKTFLSKGFRQKLVRDFKTEKKKQTNKKEKTKKMRMRREFFFSFKLLWRA